MLLVTKLRIWSISKKIWMRFWASNSLTGNRSDYYQYFSLREFNFIITFHSLLEIKSSLPDNHVPLRQFLTYGEALNTNLVDFLMWLINDTDRRIFFSTQCGIVFSSRKHEGNANNHDDGTKPILFINYVYAGIYTLEDTTVKYEQTSRCNWPLEDKFEDWTLKCVMAWHKYQQEQSTFPVPFDKSGSTGK